MGSACLIYSPSNNSHSGKSHHHSVATALAAANVFAPVATLKPAAALKPAVGAKVDALMKLIMFGSPPLDISAKVPFLTASSTSTMNDSDIDAEEASTRNFRIA